MAANLGLVAHAAQRHAHKLTVDRAGNRLPQRGLAHAGRADQAQNRRLELVHALLHGQILDNALFHLVQAKVVFVEHGFSVFQVFADLGFFLPRQLDQRFDVVAHHGGFGRHRRHHAQLAQFAIGLVAGFFAHARRFDFFLQLVQVRAFILFAQFALNGFHLLIQVVIALAFFHLPFDPATDALFYLQDVDF